MHRAIGAAGLALAAAACVTPGSRDPTTASAHATSHVGPVCGLAVAGGVLFSCSVAGVWRGTGQPTQPLEPIVTAAALPFRAFAVDARRGPDGHLLLVAGGIPAERGAVCVVAMATGRIGRGVVGHERTVADDLVYAVALHPTEPRALCACADGRILELSLPDLRVVTERARHSAAARSVAWSADGTRWASGGLDGLVVLGAADASTAPPQVLRDHAAGVECVAFLGERPVSGARDGRVRIHGADGVLLLSTDLLGAAVLSLAVADSPGDSVVDPEVDPRVDPAIACGLADGRVLGVDAATGETTAVAELRAPIHGLARFAGAWMAGTVGEVAMLW